MHRLHFALRQYSLSAAMFIGLLGTTVVQAAGQTPLPLPQSWTWKLSEQNQAGETSSVLIVNVERTKGEIGWHERSAYVEGHNAGQMDIQATLSATGSLTAFTQRFSDSQGTTMVIQGTRKDGKITFTSSDKHSRPRTFATDCHVFESALVHFLTTGQEGIAQTYKLVNPFMLKEGTGHFSLSTAGKPGNRKIRITAVTAFGRFRETQVLDFVVKDQKAELQSWVRGQDAPKLVLREKVDESLFQRAQQKTDAANKPTDPTVNALLNDYLSAGDDEKKRLLSESKLLSYKDQQAVSRSAKTVLMDRDTPPAQRRPLTELLGRMGTLEDDRTVYLAFSSLGRADRLMLLQDWKARPSRNMISTVIGLLPRLRHAAEQTRSVALLEFCHRDFPKYNWNRIFHNTLTGRRFRSLATHPQSNYALLIRLALFWHLKDAEEGVLERVHRARLVPERSVIAGALDRFHTDESRDALLGMLESERSAVVLIKVIKALDSFHEAGVVAALIEKLEEAPEGVKQVLSLSLTALTSAKLPAEKEAWSAWLEQNDAGAEVRDRTIFQLLETLDNVSILPATTVLNLEKVVSLALQLSPERSTVLTTAISLLQDETPAVRRSAIQAVSYLGTLKDAKHLLPLLDNEDKLVSQSAHQALIKLSGRTFPADRAKWEKWLKHPYTF